LTEKKGGSYILYRIELILGLLLITVVVFGAATGFTEDFDDEVLDPAWRVSFQDANGWSFTEEGTELRVTDINPAVINPGGGGTWAIVKLRRDLDPLTDFTVDFEISWDSEDSVDPMQTLYIALYDDSGSRIALAGYYDAWSQQRGSQQAIIGSEQFLSGYNTLDFNGMTSIGILREGSDVSITWDGSQLGSGRADGILNRVEIQFYYYAFEDLRYSSFFGTEAVDFIRIEGGGVGPTTTTSTIRPLVTTTTLPTATTIVTPTTTTTTTTSIRTPIETPELCEDHVVFPFKECLDCEWVTDKWGERICDCDCNMMCALAVVLDKSKLSPLGDRLRNFRDTQIQSTSAGVGFMKAFHAWYYTWSPTVAYQLIEHPRMIESVRSTVYPLVAILLLSEQTFALFGGEFGALAAGAIASFLIGAVYFWPVAILTRRLRKIKVNYRLLALILILETTLVTGSILTGHELALIASTSLFVLTFMSISAVLSAKILLFIHWKLSSSMRVWRERRKLQNVLKS
jgi:hypothetical protein